MSDTRQRQWVVFSFAFILSVAAFGMILGFVILPLTQKSGAAIDTWSAFCRAIGIQPGTPSVNVRRIEPSANPASFVSWEPEILDRLARPNQAAARPAIELCLPCHGERGLPIDPQFPDLARQSAFALYKQLSDFQSGARVNDMMTPVLQQIDAALLPDIAAHYAALQKGTMDPTVARVADPAIIQLVERGDPSRNLPACASCHGLRAGGPIETPSITGQSRNYLAQQLKLFKTGERHNDLFGRMRAVARVLSDREIARLAEYYATTPGP